MSSQFFRSASKAARSILSASKSSRFYSEGRAVAAAAAVSLSGKAPLLASAYGRSASANASKGWLSGVLALPVAGLNGYNSLFLSPLFSYISGLIWMHASIAI
ncbi:hypothetical protein COLO4_10709 [Corchorus olitorius]|uniref:Uncharacterized protein n=1 Tax=Corchorus olitorius TaxID=93759 RepID=A0A1R3K789_9ROSI|nr:hypothetical protein COLO4_10709 [Corchorus olitorius]